MKREIINPWTWQEALGFVHGNKVSDAESTFFLAGQTACDANGATLFPGDMEKQIDVVLDNIATILEQGGMDFSNVMRLNIYTVDMEKMMAAHDHMSENLKQRGCQHTGCLLGVTGLASPGALIEMEVTAVK
ncbi:RidA family protein [Gammaproteobacteria bacterium]|jgi:enamine deaminase RidA (YjgF/YER057c/UK114 family)|nr:RidA family protein [Gammaproteobacteria bacterium]MBT6043053.1 RidA family protein [Gammaproteobacteria bacterium]MDA9909361.1 RidA family protein [Gammaproteobacteria bacterium]